MFATPFEQLGRDEEVPTYSMTVRETSMTVREREREDSWPDRHETGREKGGGGGGGSGCDLGAC